MVSTQIRSRKITATEQLLGKKDFNPVSPRFDAKQLRNKAAEIAGRSDRDLALVDYAIWTATKIKALNDRRLNHPVHRLRPMDRLQVLLALVSYEIWRVQRDARKQVEVGEGGISSTIEAVDTMRSGLKLRSHEVLESAIDGFNYAVVDALREAKLCLDEGDEAPRIDEMNGADVIEYVNFGTSYRVLYERWQRVFLLGADVRRDHYKWWITADPVRAKRNAVGESRRYRQAASEETQQLRRWERTGMPDGRVAGVLLPTRVTREFNFDGEVWRFGSVLTDEAIGVDASEAAQACGALYAWIGEMAEEAFDDLGTNGRRLLEAWLVLRELAQGFMREAGPADGGAPLAPFVVDRKDLESHLAVALGCAPEHAAAYLGYLQHDAMLSTELYGHPLLGLAPDRIGIFLPGLLHANLERVMVRWLRRYLNPERVSGTQDAYALKGGHFETFVRAMLKEAAEHAELRGWSIEPGAVRFEGRDGRKGREFDLLLTFGSTLVVAEIKCSSHPADPHEIWEREELIGDAVGQVRAQVDWIRGNWAKFKERVTLPLAADLEGQRIVPVVLVDGCYGAGFAVDGVPVIDGAELKGFMLSGRFNAGHDDAGVALERLYSDPAQAEAVLPAFLEQPPIIARYLASCKTRTLIYKEPGRSKERVLYKDWIVGPEPGPDAIERRLQSINDAWRERVGAKG